jgi:UDPglucose 6-dehydrogenase
MNPLSTTLPDVEENVTLDASTAPTTPEGSGSFSPVLRPFDDSTQLTPKTRNNSRSLSSTLFDTTARTPPVRNICCVGAGYVGGPTAAVIAFQNPHIQVNVVDRDEKRIRRWNSQHPPIYEPGLNDILRIARDGARECAVENAPAESNKNKESTTVPSRKSNLFFTTEVARCISEADVVLIAVNTPTKSRGSGAGSATDMAAFEAVTAVVAQHARPGAIIVEKSTVPCRTAKLVEDTLSLYRPGVHFEVLSNPEFLAAGTAIKDLLHADRILIGSRNSPSGYRAAGALASVYASWIPRSRIITTNVFSSELAKLVANSMLAQRISSINSIAAVCDATGADVDEVASAIGADPRIGSKFLKAGIGFGGSCFKKDVLSLVYLAETLILPEVADYWRAVITMNEYSRNRFVHRVVKCLNNTLAGKKVTVLGYAFKKDTNDTRESPALDIIRTLEEEGPREIAIFDPCCIPAQMTDEIRRFVGPSVLQSNGGPVAVYADAYSACSESDAVLITTEFDEFAYVLNSKGEADLTVPVRAKARLADPRPFAHAEPTETELLALQTYLMQETEDPAAIPEDPLDRLNAVPACSENCPDCQVEKATGKMGYGASKEHVAKNRVDWKKIYCQMRRPHWVFDGRGILDIAGMERIGFKVQSVGRHSRAQ